MGGCVAGLLGQENGVPADKSDSAPFREVRPLSELSGDFKEAVGALRSAGNQEDYQLAAEKMASLAEQGYPNAYFYAAYFNFVPARSGLGDPHLGLQYLKKSTEFGEPNGLVALASFYLEGYFLSRDSEKALQYYRLAARAGHPYAQYYVGKAFLEGEGVPKDNNEALKWLEKAVFKGASAEGAYFLGNTLWRWSSNTNSFTAKRRSDLRVQALYLLDLSMRWSQGRNYPSADAREAFYNRKPRLTEPENRALKARLFSKKKEFSNPSPANR